ncbi:unnamed protein product [Victoria cruziana]
MKPIFWFCVTLLPAILLPVSGQIVDRQCMSYCGNLTVDYPFGIRNGCGHAGYRDLLFCINDVLMLHIRSGSYRVLSIDYAYRVLTLHDPGMSTCSVLKRGAGNGFVLEESRARYLKPTSDNVFMLIGCGPDSPLFQGFPTRNLPCQNISGMGCEGFYECPAWYGQRQYGRSHLGPNGGGGTNNPAGPPDCCAVSFGAIRAINLSRLQCDAYSSAYTLAPLLLESASQWMYGIHVTFSIPESHSFCQACEATGGACGYDVDAGGDLCLCNGWNSTISCDPALADRSKGGIPSENAFTVFAACLVVWLAMMRLK